jgi:hypothetical protein
MILDESRRFAIDLKKTEEYLLDQPGVLDASVWWSRGEMYAQVTVLENHSVDPQGLQRACLETLGAHQTPRNLTLMIARLVTRAA